MIMLDARNRIGAHLWPSKHKHKIGEVCHTEIRSDRKKGQKGILLSKVVLQVR